MFLWHRPLIGKGKGAVVRGDHRSVGAEAAGGRGTIRQFAELVHNKHEGGCVMRNMVISLALGAGALFAFPAADAAPLTKGLAMLPNDNIENVRLVCDQAGRCYRTRGGRRVIYGNSYGYAPGYYGDPG